MKILLVTDAWEPQMNGVVRTLTKTVSNLRSAGHDVEVISPSDGYWTMPLPTYPDIRLAPFARKDVGRRIVSFGPEAIHIATEGPLGLAARSLCLKWGMPFTQAITLNSLNISRPASPLSLWLGLTNMSVTFTIAEGGSW